MDKDKFWTSDFKLLYPQKDMMKNIMLNNNNLNNYFIVVSRKKNQAAT